MWIILITFYLTIGVGLACFMNQAGKFDKPGVDKTTLILLVIFLWPISLKDK